MLLDSSNQFAGRTIKRPCQSKQHCKCRLGAAQFQLAYIYPLNISLKCQLLLSQVCLKPACTQYSSEGFRCFQICSREMGALSFYRYNLSSYSSMNYRVITTLFSAAIAASAASQRRS
ncbi:hypothetical protein OKW39_002021 [Paraburkholderia sp. MM6662-R1]